MTGREKGASIKCTVVISFHEKKGNCNNMHAVRFCIDVTNCITTSKFFPLIANIHLDDMKDRQSFPLKAGEQLNVTQTLRCIVLRSGLTVTQECMNSI